ncbi:MAG TPA: glycosyltransferase family 39 protein [Candidatus Angelobacter sp.]|nr:glycosyltransferase family 39 protein [Candidatus Angelobacter sp.]
MTFKLELSNKIPNVLAVLLLALMAVLSGGAAMRESSTVDEVAHLGAGVSYLQKFDLRLNEEHPPLAKLLAAFPLILRGVHADYSDISWTFSNGWFHAVLGEWAWGHYVLFRWNDRDSMLFWGRLPMLALTLALGWCIYIFASRFGNPWAGVLCLAAYVATPAFLTFGPLILTDITVTFFSLLTLWTLASLWQSPSRRAMIYFGLCFAGALLSKFSSGMLLFGFLAFRLSLRFFPFPQLPTDKLELRNWRRLRGRYLWQGIFLAALTVYAVYLIFSWNQPTDFMQFLGRNPASLLLRRLLMPPVLYFRGLTLFALSSPRVTFILGHSYPHGKWFYFPILFVLKSTLAFLLSLLLSFMVALAARFKAKGTSPIPPETIFHWRAVWTFLIVFVAACMLSPMSISIRHFTIPIILLILLMAPIPRSLSLLHERGWTFARATLVAYVALTLTSVVTMVRTYPHFLPFLNSLSFGHPGYELVNDSNLDWNQSLPEAEQFIQQRGIQHVLLDEYGVIEPGIYVPQAAEIWNCQIPAPSDAGQWAIVSASMIEDGHNCVWLLHYPHTALAAGSMYAFELPKVIPPVGDPAGPPPPETFRNFGGFPEDGRLIFLECVRDPRQLQVTFDEMIARFKAEMAKRKAQRQKH